MEYGKPSHKKPSTEYVCWSVDHTLNQSSRVCKYNVHLFSLYLFLDAFAVQITGEVLTLKIITENKN